MAGARAQAAFLCAASAIVCGHGIDDKQAKTLGEAMAGEAEVQVSHFLDEHGVGAFQIKLIFWSILIALIDGYDIGAIAFAAPSLIKEWHVAPKELGLVLSASNIGVLFGSQIFGWIGDNYGRKTALIATNLLFGVFTFAAAVGRLRGAIL